MKTKWNAIDALMGTIEHEKWDKMTRPERVQIIRKFCPDGSLDFYADSTFANLFGVVQQRVARYL